MNDKANAKQGKCSLVNLGKGYELFVQFLQFFCKLEIKIFSRKKVTKKIFKIVLKNT